MIRIINGFTCWNGTVYRAGPEPVALSAEAEKRLVALGIAEYAKTPLANAPAAPCGEDGAQTGVNTSAAENAARGVQTPVSGGGTGDPSPTGRSCIGGTHPLRGKASPTGRAFVGGTGNPSPTGERIAAAASQPRNDEPDEPGEAGEAPAAEECIDVADGHMTEESLMKLTRAALVRLAVELGLEVGRRDTKAELAAKISAVELEPPEELPDDGELPPVLGAAMPS